MLAHTSARVAPVMLIGVSSGATHRREVPVSNTGGDTLREEAEGTGSIVVQAPFQMSDALNDCVFVPPGQASALAVICVGRWHGAVDGGHAQVGQSTIGEVSAKPMDGVPAGRMLGHVGGVELAGPDQRSTVGNQPWVMGTLGPHTPMQEPRPASWQLPFEH